MLKITRCNKMRETKKTPFLFKLKWRSSFNDNIKIIVYHMASGFNFLSWKSQNRRKPVDKLGLITSLESQTRYTTLWYFHLPLKGYKAKKKSWPLIKFGVYLTPTCY